VSLLFSVFGVLSLAVWYSCLHPLWMRRGAQGQTDQGSRLSERSEFSETPLGSSTAGCPQRSGGTQQPGSPFFCLLFFGEAKKSELPPGNPRPAGLSRESTRALTYRINGNVRKYSASNKTGSFFLSAASKASRISSPVGLRLKHTCSDNCATGRGLNTTSPAPPSRDRV